MGHVRLPSLAVVLLLVSCAWPPVVGAAAPDSKRLARAKDLIAEEQWTRAIGDLKAAVQDSTEKNRDEALFWLAHSQNQARDTAGAIESISRIETEFPQSRWVKPARSLRIEIAQRLRRNDFLWYVAAPPPPPAPPPPATAPAPARAPRARSGSTPPPAPSSAPALPALPAPPSAWMPEHFLPDLDLRIQALGSLMRTDAPRVIPMLREIALEANAPGEARRALFVLAQSGRADARSTVVEVAKVGSEPARIAAIRELGRLEAPGIPGALLEVYMTSSAPVRAQVVSSLGEQAATSALLQIAQGERDRVLREQVIVTLGEVGGGAQLRVLYAHAPELKRPIVAALFNARADEDLIRIADAEKDPVVRADVLARLRLLDTPRARQYLAQVKQKQPDASNIRKR